MRVDRRVPCDVLLCTRWGDVVVDVEHVHRGARHRRVSWTDSGAIVRVGTARHQLVEEIPLQVASGPLTVEARWVTPADPLEPAEVDHRLAWISANRLLIFFSAAAAMVITPREDDEGLRIQQPTRKRHLERTPISTPTKRTAPTRAKSAERLRTRGDAAHRALGALFQGSGTTSVFGPGGLNDSLQSAIDALGGNSAPSAGALALGPRGDGPGSLGGMGLPGGGGSGPLTRGPRVPAEFSVGHSGHRVEAPPSGPVRVEGGLDRDVIRTVVQRHQSELRYCYEHQLQQHPDLAGKIAITWTHRCLGWSGLGRARRIVAGR